MNLRHLVLAALALSAAVACSAPAESVDDGEDELGGTKALPDDLSVLYPLPAKGKEADLIAPSDTGAKGALIPAAFVAKLPALAANATPAMLRVVGVRIDPCFPVAGASDAAGCKNQIRVVLQPVHVDVDGKALTTDDAAVHAFYEMPRPELEGVVRDMVALRRAQGGFRTKSLGQHPILVRQGTGGAFAQGLEKILLAHAGEKSLTRVTFMTRTNSRETQWTFGAFDVKSGKLVASPIATLGSATTQTLNSMGFGGAPRLSATPAPVAKDDLSLLFDAVSAAGATKTARQRAFDAALRVENPTKNSPNTTDCASCHVVGAARSHAEAKLDVSTASTDRFTQTKLPLTNTTQGIVNGENVRAFGYLDAKPAIAQRTIHETAAVTDWVNANFKL